MQTSVTPSTTRRTVAALAATASLLLGVVPASAAPGVAAAAAAGTDTTAVATTPASDNGALPDVPADAAGPLRACIDEVAPAGAEARAAAGRACASMLGGPPDAAARRPAAATAAAMLAADALGVDGLATLRSERAVADAGEVASLAAVGAIQGIVTHQLTGRALADVCVEAYGFDGGYDYAITGASGTYWLTGLAPDDYVVYFFDCGGRGLIDELYDSAPFGLATPVTVPASTTVTDINATMENYFGISGKVVDDVTLAPLPGICVFAYTPAGTYVGQGITDANGLYGVYGAVPGEYVVEYYDCNSTGYRYDVYGDRLAFEDAETVRVPNGRGLTGINTRLFHGGSVSGKVNIPDACITAFGWVDVAYAASDSSGNWSMEGVGNGIHVLVFEPCEGDAYAVEFGGGGHVAGASEPIFVVGGRSHTVARHDLDPVAVGTRAVRYRFVNNALPVPADVTLCGPDGVCYEAHTDDNGEVDFTGLSTQQFLMSWSPDDPGLRPGSWFVTPSTSTSHTGRLVAAAATVPATMEVDGNGEGTMPTAEVGVPVEVVATAHPCLDEVGDVTATIVPPPLPYLPPIGGWSPETVEAVLTEGPAGTFSGAVTPLYPGRARLQVSGECGDSIETDLPTVYGSRVLDIQGQPVEGATVTLLRGSNADGPFTDVPDGDGQLTAPWTSNPVVTDADGRFAFDPIGSYYVIRAEKAGCVDPDDASLDYAESAPIEVARASFWWPMTLDCSTGTGLEFIPTAPCAVFDTRSAAGALAGPIGPNESIRAVVAGTIPAEQGGAEGCTAPPADAVAVELNLVAVTPSGSGNLQLAAAGVVPDGGVVNFGSGASNSSAVTVEVGDGGDIDVLVKGSTTHIRGVTLGYWVATQTAEGLEFVPLSPCAVFDTRLASGPLAGQYGRGGTRTFDVTGADPGGQGGAVCTRPPADAEAVVLNLVAIAPEANGNLMVAPAGTPSAGGVVNFATGVTNANALSVAVDGSGRVDVTVNGGPADVRGVVLGYYTSVEAAGLEFVPLAPCAVLDTRSGGGDHRGLRFGNSVTVVDVAGAIRAEQVDTYCQQPPATSRAVLVNLVAVQPRGGGNLQLAPAGQTPDGGVVNLARGITNSNALPIELAEGGLVEVTTKGGPTHLRGVTLGFYVDGVAPAT